MQRHHRITWVGVQNEPNLLLTNTIRSISLITNRPDEFQSAIAQAKTFTIPKLQFKFGTIVNHVHLWYAYPFFIIINHIYLCYARTHSFWIYNPRTYLHLSWPTHWWSKRPPTPTCSFLTNVNCFPVPVTSAKKREIKF